jgi:cytochrome c biogenesis protein CcdA
MRALQISGLVLIAIGLWFIIRPPSYSREESVFKFGDVEARMQEQRSLPGWVGGAALGAGLVLVAVGFRRS